MAKVNCCMFHLASVVASVLASVLGHSEHYKTAPMRLGSLCHYHQEVVVPRRQDVRYWHAKMVEHLLVAVEQVVAATAVALVVVLLVVDV